MAPKRVFRRHLPLITPRIGFAIQILPPPPHITLRINLAERINHHRPQLDGDAAVTPTPVVAILAKKPVRPAHSDTMPQAPAPHDKAQVPGVGSDLSDLSDLESIDELAGHPKQPAAPGTSTTKLIRKPPGEPGRPHSGGFNLEDAVVSSGWPTEDFATFRKRAHELISQTLDESRAFSKQPQYKMLSIYNKLKKEFPRLRQYEEFWPATSIVKAKLKSSSEAARRQAKATSPASRETPGE